MLTTVITPWQILWGKLIAGLRVSSVLTLFLVWPVLLACVMVSVYWTNLLAVVAYLLIVLITCLTTAMIALFCSVLFKKTPQAMMTTYLVIIVLFSAPLAVQYFAETFFPYDERSRSQPHDAADSQRGLHQPVCRGAGGAARHADMTAERQHARQRQTLPSTPPSATGRSFSATSASASASTACCW